MKISRIPADFVVDAELTFKDDTPHVICQFIAHLINLDPKNRLGLIRANIFLEDFKEVFSPLIKMKLKNGYKGIILKNTKDFRIKTDGGKSKVNNNHSIYKLRKCLKEFDTITSMTFKITHQRFKNTFHQDLDKKFAIELQKVKVMFDKQIEQGKLLKIDFDICSRQIESEKSRKNSINNQSSESKSRNYSFSNKRSTIHADVLPLVSNLITKERNIFQSLQSKFTSAKITDSISILKIKKRLNFPHVSDTHSFFMKKKT